ncbi:plasma kallikrein [Nephila pilipes]|uniref:Plasma kallikrein n=1 Tax=Nephila pilipes TaxID=299642 RepID=A0A8X6J0M7_NEPPI|nr:plasma kallikrein [Nephila pilipes]
MHFGGLQCCISIFVFLNLQVISTGQNVGRNFSQMDGQTSEQDDNDNGDCMKCGLGVIEREGRVVNGEEVKPLNKYPWIIPLKMADSVVCGGALISRTFILTAAHCIFDELKSDRTKCIGYSPAKECYISENEFSIYLLGSERFGQKLEIKRFLPHDMYHHNLIINDIALIELAQPLKCSSKTFPICLATKEEMYKEDQKILVAGWGWNTPMGYKSRTTLREGVMRQVSPQNCMVEELPKKTVNQFQCANGTDQSICVGDSGTSTFIKFKKRFYTLGVSSNILASEEFPIECIPTSFSTFSKVLYFSKWIETHVKDLPEP